MINRIELFLKKSICVSLVFTLIGCGTLMYPERKGQKSGKIDPNVAILDGLGLLCFLIPGIIAFAVDFSNGTIYLPGTSSIYPNSDNLNTVHFDPNNATYETIENIVESKINQDIDLTSQAVQVSKLDSKRDIIDQIAEVIALEDEKLIVASIQ